VVLDRVVHRGAVARLEREVVGEIAAMDARDLDAHGLALRLIDLGAEPADLVQGPVCDRQ